MIEPLPKLFSILSIAACKAFSFSLGAILFSFSKLSSSFFAIFMFTILWITIQISLFTIYKFTNYDLN